MRGCNSGTPRQQLSLIPGWWAQMRAIAFDTPRTTVDRIASKGWFARGNLVVRVAMQMEVPDLMRNNNPLLNRIESFGYVD